MSVKRKFNQEKHGIELYFDKKPDAKILGILKSNEWHWNHKKLCWYKKDYKETREFSAWICEHVNGTGEKSARKASGTLKKSSSGASRPARETSPRPKQPIAVATSTNTPEPKQDTTTNTVSAKPDLSSNNESETVTPAAKPVWIRRFVIGLLIVLIVIAGGYVISRYRAHKAAEERYQKDVAYFKAEYKKDLKSYTKMNQDNDIYMDYIKRQYRNGTLKQQISYYNDMIDYQHLGENINDSLKFKGHTILDGDIVRLKEGDQFQYTITEEDSIPDSSTVTLYVTNLTKDGYLYGYYWSGKMTVHEIGGTRYPGAYATFKYKVSVDPYVNRKAFHRYAVRRLKNSYKNINKQYHIF